ncbi:MAG: hypothetical protein K2Q23_03830 [Bryobacteraceae bacterium]|nr:hypothetical protein [Bryobacteraceae bacterium]
MAYRIRRVEYFYAMVKDEPGEAYRVLNLLAAIGIGQVAFCAIPVGPLRTQLTIFPDDSAKLVQAAKQTGLGLDGPHPAILVQGDDELGALAGLHERLFKANVNVYAATGVSDGKGSYGYLIYVKDEDFERAAAALEV